MGFFDFFKKRTSENNLSNRPIEEKIDSNSYLLEVLKNKLLELGYKVERHQQYLALVVNSEIEIATAIIENPNYHQGILHLTVLTIHPKYFPNCIEENIVGVGSSISEKVNSVLDNFIGTTFLPIIDSFSDSHNPELDFLTLTNNKEVLWHPKLGNLTTQGQWKEIPQNEPLFEIIKDKVKDRLTSNKINWLKIYISKRADGTIIGECLFNNEPWEEGLRDITEYAKSWKVQGDFYGMKQFIVFRKCDAYDE